MPPRRGRSSPTRATSSGPTASSSSTTWRATTPTWRRCSRSRAPTASSRSSSAARSPGSRRSHHAAEVAERLAAAKLAHDAVDEAVAVEDAAVGDRRDQAALALDEPGHRLVDRVGRQQVPGGHGVALADAVAAVLGLVVQRRRPLELEEGDVRRARERDALSGHAGGADDELGALGILEGLDGGLALGDRVAAEDVQGVGEALEHGVLDL